MKFKFLLSVMSLIAIAGFSLPAANAQEGGGAPSQRWHFAPNVYAVEQPTGPKHHYASYSPATRTVTTGSVPKGSSFLGINPAILKPRMPAPIPQPIVTAQVVPAHFDNAFGKPMTASPTALPLTANPAAAMAQPKAAAPRVSHPSRSHAQSVNGRLRTPVQPRALSASPRAIASYGQGNGYTPGYNTPSAGSGYSTSTAVSASLRHK